MQKPLTMWRQYKALHPLFRFRKMSSSMITFIKNNITHGTTLSVDSFPWALKKQITIDKIIELSKFRVIWDRLGPMDITFVDSLKEIANDTQYNNIVLAGLTPFKYKTIDECATVIDNLVPLLKSKGTMLVAIPITNLIFHRLKFSYDQIIDNMHLVLSKNGLAITDRLLDIDIFYIKITKL